MRALKKLELTTLISEWITKEPKRSINSLAKKVRISEMTVRRVASGESKPGMETALPLLTVVAPELVNDFMRDHFPEYWDLLEKAVDSVLDETDSELEFHLRSPISTRIICQAKNPKGVTKSAIEHQMGSEGSKKFVQLLEEGILIENQGAFHLSRELKLSKKAKLDMAQSLMQTFELLNLGSYFASMHAQSEYFSEEALVEINKEVTAIADKLSAMRTNPDYIGDIPIYWIGAINTLG